MRLLVGQRIAALALVVGGCSNLGPFRAEGTGADPDAATTGDGKNPDGSGGLDPDGPPGAQPRELGSSPYYPTVLAAADGYVYFTELGTAPYGVARVAASGGTISRISLGSTVPYSIAAQSGAVVWTTSGTVVRANSAFTSGSTLATETGLTGELALSSTDAYFGRHGSGANAERIESVPLAGGTPVPIYTTLSSSADLASSSSDFYWTTFTSGYELRKSSFSTPASFTKLADTAAGLLSASGSTVCWMVQPDPNQYKYDVWCYRQGTAARIASDYAQVFDVLVTTSDVFIAVRGPGNVGQIVRYRPSTQALATYITLGTGDLPTALASDGTDLFWIASHTAPEGSATVYALAL